MIKKSLFSVILVPLMGLTFCSGCALNPFTSTASAPLPVQTVRYQDFQTTRQDPAALKPTEATSIKSPQEDGEDVVERSQVVKQVNITGNNILAEHEIMRRIRTRPGRYFDPDQLQQDVNELWKVKQIRRVSGPFVDRQKDGIVVTIQIIERPYIDKVQYIGNRGLTDKELATETGLSGGQPLDLHAVKMAKSRMEDLYSEKGFPKTEVTIIEGDELGDNDVIFLIHEDKKQKIYSVTFEGNEIASDSRLKSFIKMKPGILWVFGGTSNRRELEQDRMRLETYYRSLGFFNARIGRELVEKDSGGWLSIHYIINEGPRYRIRNVSFIGNEKYSSAELQSVLKLKPKDSMPEFNVSKMNLDVRRLQDLYGSEGYVFADVKAEPRFLEEPGMLDLVYNISEGQQYRVGEINVVIEGEYGITQRQVIFNRLGMRPGDLFNTRLMREAEARLKRSQLFADGSAASPGAPPRVTLKTPEPQELENNSRRR